MQPTVANLISALQKLPQDAIVHVGKEETGSWSNFFVFEQINVEDIDVFDYTSIEDRLRYPSMAGKIIIRFNAI